MSTQNSIQSIHETIDEILNICKSLPEGIVTWKPDENKWSILEVLCHVEEATPYWLNEIERLIQNPGAEWGRGLQHEGRLAAVAQADKRQLDEVCEGIAKSKEKVRSVLSSLDEKDLAKEAPSRNPRFGTKPLQFIVDHLLVEHLITHLKQINRNIQQFANPIN